VAEEGFPPLLLVEGLEESILRFSICLVGSSGTPLGVEVPDRSSLSEVGETALLNS
jgi:hypothetical protein